MIRRSKALHRLQPHPQQRAAAMVRKQVKITQKFPARRQKQRGMWHRRYNWIPQDLNSLDPNLAEGSGTQEILFNIYEGLYKPDSNGNLLPAVASGYTMSEDGLVYTFTLRDGIKFHDGNPVTVADVKYSIEKCKERDATYAAPLKVKVRLYNKEKEEISEHEIFMGDLPLMTETGTFVINGAERVIVSQLVRSPGIYYAIGHDKIGKRLFLPQ